jgi:hypothetical protein
MSENQRFKWLLEVEVPEYWVKGGFDFHEDTCSEVAESIIKFAYHDKVKVRVVQAPDPIDIRRSQDPEEQPVTNVTQRITTPPSPAPNPSPSTPSHAAQALGNEPGFPSYLCPLLPRH